MGMVNIKNMPANVLAKLSQDIIQSFCLHLVVQLVQESFPPFLFSFSLRNPLPSLSIGARLVATVLLPACRAEGGTRSADLVDLMR